MWLFTMYIFFKLCLFVLLTLSPSLSPGAHLCQSQDLLALESAFSSYVDLLIPVASFYWPFVLHLLDFQRKVTTAVPVAGCTSVCKKAWCRSPFLTISLGSNSCQLWTFFSFPFSFQHVIFCLEDLT